MSAAGDNEQWSDQPDAKTQRFSMETDVGLNDREFEDDNDEDDSETKNPQNDEVSSFVPMIIVEVEARPTEYDGAASNPGPNEHLNPGPLATKKRDTADHTSDAETIAELTRKLASFPSIWAI